MDSNMCVCTDVCVSLWRVCVCVLCVLSRRLQLLMFSVLFLAVAVVTNTFVLGVPLALGRYFFAPLSSELAHDFLPLCVGVTAAAALVLLVERSSTYLAAQLRETPRQVYMDRQR